MRFRRRRSLMPRIGRRPSPEEAAPLKGQLWTRSERALKEPDVHWLRRAIAVGVAVAECALLGWLWFGPTLSIKAVEVSGAHHLTEAQVAAALGLDSGRSILAIDGESDRRHLVDQVWVRTATVDPQLDGTVVVHVTEWQPIAAYHAGPSKNYFLLSSQATVLGQAAAAGALVDIQGPAGPDPRVGSQAIDPALLVALVNIPRGLLEIRADPASLPRVEVEDPIGLAEAQRAQDDRLRLVAAAHWPFQSRAAAGEYPGLLMRSKC